MTSGAAGREPPPDPSARSGPALTIVIGSRRAEPPPERCLAALGPQVTDDVEVVLVHDGVHLDAPPWLHELHSRRHLVPELWAEGLRRATGRIVALTTGAVAPDPGWVARILAAHHDDPEAVGVGGAIEPGHGLTLVDWAVYFCRYTPYMLPLTSQDLEVAGDNASYRRNVLEEYRDSYADAFWETFVHDRMRADGRRLVVLADVVVRQVPGMRAGTFSRQRFAHGRAYGRLRSAEAGRRATLVGAGMAPLVPGLMTARAARGVWGRRRHRVRFLSALPLLAWFYSCWAVGELAGRLEAIRLDAVRPTERARA